MSRIDVETLSNQLATAIGQAPYRSFTYPLERDPYGARPRYASPGLFSSIAPTLATLTTYGVAYAQIWPADPTDPKAIAMLAAQAAYVLGGTDNPGWVQRVVTAHLACDAASMALERIYIRGDGAGAGHVPLVSGAPLGFQESDIPWDHVDDTSSTSASVVIPNKSGTGPALVLTAALPGTWGNSIFAFVDDGIGDGTSVYRLAVMLGQLDLPRQIEAYDGIAGNSVPTLRVGSMVASVVRVTSTTAPDVGAAWLAGGQSHTFNDGLGSPAITVTLHARTNPDDQCYIEVLAGSGGTGTYEIRVTAWPCSYYEIYDRIIGAGDPAGAPTPLLAYPGSHGVGAERPANGSYRLSGGAGASQSNVTARLARAVALSSTGIIPPPTPFAALAAELTAAYAAPNPPTPPPPSIYTTPQSVVCGDGVTRSLSAQQLDAMLAPVAAAAQSWITLATAATS